MLRQPRHHRAASRGGARRQPAHAHRVVHVRRRGVGCRRRLRASGRQAGDRPVPPRARVRQQPRQPTQCPAALLPDAQRGRRPGHVASPLRRTADLEDRAARRLGRRDPRHPVGRGLRRGDHDGDRRRAVGHPAQRQPGGACRPRVGPRPPQRAPGPRGAPYGGVCGCGHRRGETATAARRGVDRGWRAGVRGGGGPARPDPSPGQAAPCT